MNSSNQTYNEQPVANEIEELNAHELEEVNGGRAIYTGTFE